MGIEKHRVIRLPHSAPVAYFRPATQGRRKDLLGARFGRDIDKVQNLWCEGRISTSGKIGNHKVWFSLHLIIIPNCLYSNVIK